MSPICFLGVLAVGVSFGITEAWTMWILILVWWVWYLGLLAVVSCFEWKSWLVVWHNRWVELYAGCCHYRMGLLYCSFLFLLCKFIIDFYVYMFCHCSVGLIYCWFLYWFVINFIWVLLDITKTWVINFSLLIIAKAAVNDD